MQDGYGFFYLTVEGKTPDKARAGGPTVVLPLDAVESADNGDERHQKTIWTLAVNLYTSEDASEPEIFPYSDVILTRLPDEACWWPDDE